MIYRVLYSTTLLPSLAFGVLCCTYNTERSSKVDCTHPQNATWCFTCKRTPCHFLNHKKSSGDSGAIRFDMNSIEKLIQPGCNKYNHRFNNIKLFVGYICLCRNRDLCNMGFMRPRNYNTRQFGNYTLPNNSFTRRRKPQPVTWTGVIAIIVTVAVAMCVVTFFCIFCQQQTC